MLRAAILSLLACTVRSWEWPWKVQEEILAEAVRANNEQTLPRLNALWGWQQGLDLDAQDEDRQYMTAMSAAAWHTNHEVVRWLIQRGASPNAKCRNGWTPLMISTNRGDQRTMRLLLSAGADIDARTAKTLLTPLMFAAQSNRAGAARLLLQRGAAAGLRNRDKQTALEMARAEKHDGAVFELTRKPGELGPEWDGAEEDGDGDGDGNGDGDGGKQGSGAGAVAAAAAPGAGGGNGSSSAADTTRADEL